MHAIYILMAILSLVFADDGLEKKNQLFGLGSFFGSATPPAPANEYAYYASKKMMDGQGTDPLAKMRELEQAKNFERSYYGFKYGLPSFA